MSGVDLNTYAEKGLSRLAMEHEQQQEEEEEQENPDGKREERSQSKPAMDLKQLKSQLAVTRSNNNNESSTRSCLSLPPLGSNEVSGVGMRDVFHEDLFVNMG